MPGGDRESKGAARAEARVRRDGMSAEERARKSEEIARRVVGLDEARAAKRVLVYAAFGSEVETMGLVHAWLAEGKRVALPKTDKTRRALELYYVREPLGEVLAPGVWGIPEPVPERCEKADAAEIDLVVAPGVAFDEAGGRLGYGGGYYDRLLRDMAAKGHLPALVALAFEAQMTADMPKGPGDFPVPTIVTEARVIRTGAKARRTQDD
jgi:5-formyltetrahydrofolate cyclo-ligase